MMSISSQAGRRLAKAKADMDRQSRLTYVPRIKSIRAARTFNKAAKALADELIAGGFHEMDGED